MNDAFRLHGSRAVVTGGSRGIGSEICVALARSGADVVSIHRGDPEGAAATTARIEALGRRCVMVDGDTGRVGRAWTGSPGSRSPSSAASTSG